MNAQTHTQTMVSFDNLPKIVAVDFDGTLVEDDFPNIGAKNEQMFRVMKALKSQGVKIILWTSRNNDALGDLLEDAVKYCKKEGLTFDAVNENLKEVQELTGADTRKIYADLYIDDKSVPHSQAPLYWVDRLGFKYSRFVGIMEEMRCQERML